MNNSESRLLMIVIACLLAAMLGKLWQIEGAMKRAETAASCPR